MPSMRWMAIALVLVGVAALSVPPVLAAKGGNGKADANGKGNSGAPTLTVTPNPHAEVGQWVTVTGEGFPRETTALVVIDPMMPTLLAETDRAGSFETGVAFAEPGTYTFSACYYQKNHRWDCTSTAPVSLEVTE